MARKGRKRKLVPRENNGRAKRSTQPQQDCRMVAARQPHRNGSMSDRLGTAVGRFLDSGSYLVKGKSLNGLHEAAKRFEEAHRIFQVSIGAPRPFANAESGSGDGMTAEATGEARAKWMTLWRVIRHQGERVERGMFAMLIDPQPEEWQPPFWIQFSVVEGLTALAKHFVIDIEGEDKEAPGRLLNAA